MIIRGKSIAGLLILVSLFMAIGCDSESSEKGLQIGDRYKGGVIAYILKSNDPGYISGETHGLIAALADQSDGISWIIGGDTDSTENGNTSTEFGTGNTNTTAMLAQTGCTGGAAKICDDYINDDTGTGVYSDWYLPSKDELNKLFINKPYIKGFSADSYWSSSEYCDDEAWFQHFYFGTQYHSTYNAANTKREVEGRVRPVRSF